MVSFHSNDFRIYFHLVSLRDSHILDLDYIRIHGSELHSLGSNRGGMESSLGFKSLRGVVLKGLLKPNTICSIVCPPLISMSTRSRYSVALWRTYSLDRAVTLARGCLRADSSSRSIRSRWLRRRLFDILWLAERVAS